VVSKSLPPLSVNANAEKILAEAWLLFQSKGYRGASMDEICRRCNITKPTLYYYFQDKETLYFQTLLHQLHGYRAILEQPTTLTERLVDFARAMLDNFRVDLSAMLRDMEHISDQNYRRLIDEAHQTELIEPVTALMRAGMRRGELRKGDSALYAWTFFGLVNTFIQSRHGLDQANETLARLLVDLFLHGAGVSSQG
jgi:TetR/AcrR family transcriptional regulator, mexJK operon transcriptional repressor